MPNKERFRICEVPYRKGYFFVQRGHADANSSMQKSFGLGCCSNCCEAMRCDGNRAGASIVHVGREGFSAALRGFSAHGSTIGICAPAFSLRIALSAPAAALSSVHIDCCYCSGCLLSGHSIWREVPGRQPIGGTSSRE